MKINGIKIKFNPTDRKCIKRFEKAFRTVSDRAEKIENKLENEEISLKTFKTKQISIIRDFFYSITKKSNAERLFLTCNNFQDYIDIFERCTKMCRTTADLFKLLVKSNEQYTSR